MGMVRVGVTERYALFMRVGWLEKGLRGDKYEGLSRVFPSVTLVSFTQKYETMQNAENPKKIVRLTLLDALMCPKT